MRTFACLVVLSLFLVVRFHLADGFTFPSILDDARQAVMKFSKPSSTTSGGSGIPPISTRRRTVVVSRRRRIMRPRPSYSTRRRAASSSSRRRIFIGTDMISASIDSGEAPTGYTAPIWTPVPTLSPKKRRRASSNSLLEILSKVEKHILEAEANGNRAHLKSLTKNIKIALQQRSYLFAREALGQALYRSLSGISKRSKPDGVSYLTKLRNEIGTDKFNKLLGVHDDKTLMFVIDDTGSMWDEISAVKKITKAIVQAQKREETDYILSVFNDPTTCPAKEITSGKAFNKEVEKLRAHGGGDYAELTFTGILAAMEKGPSQGSPMYVFTDATSKDHTKDNIKTLIESASGLDININFFTTSSASSFEPFVKVARETCGMILRLVDSSEIMKLESITKLSLRNSGVCVDAGTVNSTGGKKRAVPRSKVILVDDSVKNMIISVSTENPNPIIVLRDPSGGRFTGRKISLYRAAIYELINPTPGRWTLSVTESAGKYHYIVRGSSDSNIDFDYYFVMVPKYIPINQPLAGQRANAIITVAGAERIQQNRLSLELIDSRNGGVLKTVAMTPRSRSKADNVYFHVSFTPPLTPFNLRMKGQTKAGNSFERSSRKTIGATTALIRVYKAKDGQLTVPRGRRMFVILLIFNVGPSEIFDVAVNDPKRYATTRRKQRVRVYRNRSRRFILWFTAPSSATPGKGYSVAVTIKGRKSRVQTGQILNFIVV